MGAVIEWGTQAGDQKLAELAAQGLSASQISQRIKGAPARGGVLKKAQRLGIKLLQTPGGNRGGGRPPKGGHAKTERAIRLRQEIRQTSQEHFFWERPDAFAPLPGTTPTKLLDLRSGDCRYPVDGMHGRDHLFCGEPCAEEQSYCPAHRGFVYARANTEDLHDGG